MDSTVSRNAIFFTRLQFFLACEGTRIVSTVVTITDATKRMPARPHWGKKKGYFYALVYVIQQNHFPEQNDMKEFMDNIVRPRMRKRPLGKRRRCRRSAIQAMTATLSLVTMSTSKIPWARADSVRYTPGIAEMCGLYSNEVLASIFRTNYQWRSK